MSGVPGSATATPSYAGDVGAAEAWDALKSQNAAQLVDVRTDAEWNYVGVPDLSSLGRSTLFCKWQRFPAGEQNADFAAELEAALKAAGYQRGAPIYFICRSGARSRSAAIVMTQAGYGPCFNLRDGFEGGLDPTRHRGAAGWKAEGLPWIQF